MLSLLKLPLDKDHVGDAAQRRQEHAGGDDPQSQFGARDEGPKDQPQLAQRVPGQTGVRQLGFVRVDVSRQVPECTPRSRSQDHRYIQV
jgi:hypothetical protein